MKKKIFFQVFLAAVVLIVLKPHTAVSSHIVGGELTYTYLGIDATNLQRPFRFKIKLVTYIDRSSQLPCGCLNNCNGSSATATVCSNLNYFGVYDASTGQRIERLSMPIFKDNEAAPVPPVGCVVPGLSNLQISRVFGEVEVNLPFSPDGFHIVYQRCCRNNDLLTLLNPSAAGNTFHCFIPNPLLANSSPQFTDVNLPFFCKGDTATFNNNAFDPDGDRLIYSFVAAYNSSGTANFDCGGPNNPNCPPQNFSFPPSNVTYRTNQGYTPTAMFGPTGFATINPSSGLAKLYSSIAGQFLVTIEIKEYRTLPDGTEILINSTRRELQFIVRDCPPSPCVPALNDISGSDFPTEINIQSGQNISFPVVFKLNNTGTLGACQTDSLKLSATGSIFDNSFGFQGPFASFPEKDSVGSVSSQFNWQTTCAIRGAYYVNLKADYNGCPPTTLNQTVAINVIPPPTMGQIFGATALCEGATNQLYRIQTQLPDSSFTWSVSGGGTILSNVKNDSVRITWNTPGLHTIKVKQISPGGCADSITLVVNVSQRVAVNAGTDQTICQGNSTTIQVSGGYPPNYSISPSGSFNATTATFTVSPSATTNYIITSQNAVGCISRDTVRITVIPRGARAGANKTICSGATTQIGEPSLSGYTYLWAGENISNPNVANPTVSPTNNTNAPLSFKYILTATHTASNCVSKDSVLITVNPKPTANLPDTQSVCANVTSSIGTTAQTGFSYQWLTTTGISNPNVANPSINFINNTNDFLYFTYILQITNTTTNCVGLDTTVVAVRPAVLADAGSDKTNCLNIPIQIGSATQTGLAYSWSPATGLNNPAIANPTVSQNTVGTYKYILTVTDSFGCIGKDSVNVTITPGFTANAGSDRTICSGATTFLGAAPQAGVVYNWLPTTGLSNSAVSNPSLTLTNTSATAQTFSYVLSVSDNQGLCASSDTVLITVNTLPAPVANAGEDTVVCSGTVLGVGSNPITNYSYVWSPSTNLSATNIANPSVNAINNGTNLIFQRYLLEVTDNGNGCKNLDSLIIQVNPLPVANAGADRTLCAGNSTNFGSGLFPTPNHSYLWTPATFLNNATLLNPTLTIPSNSISEVITYTLTVTNNATGCSRKDSALVTINALPTANAGIDKIICSGATTQLGTTAIAGNNYAWTPSTGLTTPNQATTDVSRIYTGNNSSTTFEYVLMVTSAANCVKRDTVLLTVNKLPDADAGNNITLCSNDTGLIGTPAITGYTYSWTSLDGANLIGSSQAQPSVTAQVSSFTTFRMALQVTETATNCSNSDTVTVTVNPLPTFDAGADVSVCVNDTAEIGQPSVAIYTFQWTPTQGIIGISNSNTALVSWNIDTVINYVLAATEIATGCQATDTVQVTVLPLPFANAGIDAAICSGDSLTIGTAALVGNQYSWSPAVGLTANNVAQPIVTLTIPNNSNPTTNLYVLNVTDSNNCSAQDSVTITVQPKPAALPIIKTADVVCPGVEAVLYRAVGQLGLTYAWQISGGTIVAGQGTDSILVDWGANNPNAKVYLTVTNTFNCSSETDSVTISINPNLKPTLPLGDTLLCLWDAKNVLYQSSFTNGAAYTWQSDDVTTNFVNGTGSNVLATWQTDGIKKLWVTETDTTNLAFCFGVSDTLLITIHPNPDSTLSLVVNNENPCLNTNDNFTLNGLSNSNYVWQIITPSTTLTDSNNVITANWNEVGTHTISVIETTDKGCVGKPITAIITVRPIPAPSLTSNDTTICPQTLNNRTYSVSGFNNSIFNWLLQGGSAIAINNNSITLNWTQNAANYQLGVIETSEFGCISDTLRFNFLQDNTRLNLRYVTTQIENDANIDVVWNLINASNYNNPISIQRWNNGTWQTINSSAKSDTIFTDLNLNTDNQIYTYRLQGVNRCGITLNSTEHSSILLAGTANEANNSVRLNWNSYQGWSGANSILRNNDNRGFALLQNVAIDTVFTAQIGKDGFNQCFRVLAREINGTGLSYSNIVCLDYENTLIVPNIITPNNDGQNEAWSMDNGKLYQVEVEIYNRWGKKLYQNNNYQGNWKADNLPSGIYFYRIKYTAKGMTYEKNGYLNVMR